MAFRLVGGAGALGEAAAVSLYASGVVRPGEAVDIVRNGTGGAVVAPAATATHSTAIFGVALDYAQGASDTLVRVIPFDPSQNWEVDCANAASTAQLGLRHALSASRGIVHNTGTDQGSADALAARMDAVFLALSMVGSTTGSGKLIGKFYVDQQPVNRDAQT